MAITHTASGRMASISTKVEAFPVKRAAQMSVKMAVLKPM